MKKLFILATFFLCFSEYSLAATEGKDKNISPYNHSLPVLYELDKQPVENISPLIKRQMIHTNGLTFAKWTFAKGAIVPLHHHINEQLTWIVAGSVEVFSQGKRYIVKAGDIIVFPPNIPHEFHSLEDNTIDIDIFTPQRQDWIDGNASYLKQLKN